MTHQVIDLATKKPVFKGTEEECETFILETTIIAHLAIRKL